MAPPSRWPLRVWLLVAVIAALGASAINPYNVHDFRLEVSPLPFFVGFLWFLEWKWRPLSNASYWMICVFLLLHLLGAHYLYSFVPYDRWSDALFGISISEIFSVPISEETGEPRNHFDRLVHFLFGALMTLPMCETVERTMNLTRGKALIVAVAFLGVMSKVYELVEWWLTLVMDPENAEAYNGQQGDIFDAHKDMALALAGSAISATLIWFIGRRTAAPTMST
jgi:putative membrane protein